MTSPDTLHQPRYHDPNRTSRFGKGILVATGLGLALLVGDKLLRHPGEDSHKNQAEIGLPAPSPNLSVIDRQHGGSYGGKLFINPDDLPRQYAEALKRNQIP